MEPYIKKSALVAEIKGYISNYKEIVAKTNRNDSTWVDSVSMIDAKIDVLQHVLFFLDTLEAKEVDLKKEFDKCCENYIFDDEYDVYIARRFFELGMQVSNKAQKGE